MSQKSQDLSSHLQKMIFEMELRGYSPQTQNHYLCHVKLLEKHTSKPAPQLTPDELKQYLHYRIKSGIGYSSINISCNAFKLFFNKVLGYNWSDDVIILPNGLTRLFRGVCFMEDIGSNMQSIMTRERTTKDKKHLLFSDQVENKKQVLQEYIDSVCVSHSKDNGINVKLNVRVFDGGGELTLLKTLYAQFSFSPVPKLKVN